MNLKKHRTTLKLLSGSIFFATILLLAFMVLKSGYFFEFYIDELYHANTAYLIAQGYSPFKDFFLPYSPLFHVSLIPLFTQFGFTLETIQWTRLVMIALFAVRVVTAAVLVRMLFGTLAAILFVPLLLLDPLTEYSSMQIRPDNLMLTVYVVGVWLLTKGLLQKKKYLAFLSGILLGLAILLSIKIAPSMGVILLILTGLRFKYTFTGLRELWLGCILPIAIFCIYYSAKGLLSPMITNLLFDARLINEALKYPVPMGNFYRPSDATTYGLSFKPALFQYLWSLPLLSFAGVYATFQEFDFSFLKFSKKRTIGIILSISLVAQWLSLFFVRSVFIQYYLPVTYLFAIFAAVAVAKIIHTVQIHKFVYTATLLFFSIIYMYLLIPSLQANSERAKRSGAEQKMAITAIWNYVPETSAVYPGVLFRPLAYPVPYGFTFYDLPQSIFSRYEPVQNYLKKNDVQYLNIDGKPWALPDETVVQYINAHYAQDKEYPLFWKQK